MITVDINLIQLRNELSVLINELEEALTKDDNERRACIKRLMEKIKTLRSRLENSPVTLNVK